MNSIQLMQRKIIGKTKIHKKRNSTKKSSRKLYFIKNSVASKGPTTFNREKLEKIRKNYIIMRKYYFFLKMEEIEIMMNFDSPNHQDHPPKNESQIRIYLTKILPKQKLQ